MKIWVTVMAWLTTARDWARDWASHPHRVTAAAVYAMGAGVVVAFLVPPTYTVSMTVMPETQTAGSGLRAVAGVLGPLSGAALQALGAEGQVLTPEFIARAAISDTVLLTVARTAEENLGKPIYQMCKCGGRSQADSVMRAVKYLRRRVVSAETDRRTPLVAIAVATHDSLLSTVIGRRLLDALNQVLIVNRQTAVSNQRRFLQERNEAARLDLRQAENRMKGFLERNRTYEQSPNLRFEYGSLERDIALAQEIYLTVARQLQIVEADEVRNTPVLNALESPRPPTRADSRRAPLIGAACGLMVVALAIGTTLLERFRAPQSGLSRESASVR